MTPHGVHRFHHPLTSEIKRESSAMKYTPLLYHLHTGLKAIRGFYDFVKPC